MNPTDIHVETTHVPPCGRCGAEPYLQVSIPHQWQLSNGISTPGRRIIRLCPQCDANWPPAHGLIAYLALHNGHVVDHTAHEFANLLREWLTNLPPTDTPAHTIEQEHRAYLAGRDPDQPEVS